MCLHDPQSDSGFGYKLTMIDKGFSMRVIAAQAEGTISSSEGSSSAGNDRDTVQESNDGTIVVKANDAYYRTASS